MQADSICMLLLPFHALTTRLPIRVTCAMLLLLCTGGVLAEQTGETTCVPIGSLEELPSAGSGDLTTVSGLDDQAAAPLVFGHITVRAGDLFDLSNESENAFVHAAANTLHMNTRNATVAHVLPFTEGDPFSVDRMAEAERLLRAKRYLRDAFVTPHRLCGNRVDVEVKTIDNWTLTPSVSVGSAGGDTRYAIEIQDLNVLGLGKEFRLRNANNGVSQETIFAYRDDNVFGSHYRLLLGLSDEEGDQSYVVQGGLPFFSTEAPKSWWLKLTNETRSLEGSNAISAVEPPDWKQTRSIVEYSRARKIENSTLPLARLGVGVRVQREQTSDAATDTEIDSATDFDEVYPFLQATWSDSRWLTRKNFLSLHNNEDIDLGLRISAEMGLLLAGLGNEENAFRLELDVSKGWYSGADSLHKLTFHQVRYFEGEDDARQELSAHYQFFRWFSERNQLDLRLTAESLDGYSPFDSLAVGGEDGLRGYPNRFQVGERRILGLAEYRHITGWSPWSLVNTAFTGFVEGGRAWAETDADTLVDVGFGLLLSPTRSSRSAINRFDIAFPLTSNGDVDTFQVFIGSSLNF